MDSLASNLSVIRRLNRERVLAFELELTQKLEVLNQTELKIQTTSQQRQAWLKNISSTYHSESAIHNKMIQVIQAECELAALQFQLDILRMEGQYDGQKLQLLVEATKPLQSDETQETRNLFLQRKARENSDLLCTALEQSLAMRMRLVDHCHDLKLTLAKIEAQAKVELKVQTEDVQHKLESYQVKMQESANRSNTLYQEVLHDYLVLRHNATVAEEILQRSQLDARKARSELQDCLQRFLAAADEERQKLQVEAAREINLQTADLRKEVMTREQELETLRLRVQRLSKQRVRSRIDLLDRLARLEQSYRTLEQQRRDALILVREELDHLRSSLVQGQKKLLVNQDLPVPYKAANQAGIDHLHELLQGLSLYGQKRASIP